MNAFGEDAEDLAGDVALEATHDLLGAESFGAAAGDVDAGAFVAAHADERDAPERVVGLTVAATVEAMPTHPAGGGFEGRDAAELRERCFVAEPVRVVASGDQQDRGGVRADAAQLEQLGARPDDERLDLAVESVEFLVSWVIRRASSRSAKRVAVVGSLASATRNRAHVSIRSARFETPELVPQLLWRGRGQRAQLVDGLDAGAHRRAAHDPQRADRFDVTVTGLRRPGGGPVERGASGGLGVDRVRLALLPSGLRFGRSTSTTSMLWSRRNAAVALSNPSIPDPMVSPCKAVATSRVSGAPAAARPREVEKHRQTRKLSKNVSASQERFSGIGAGGGSGLEWFWGTEGPGFESRQPDHEARR